MCRYVNLHIEKNEWISERTSMSTEIKITKRLILYAIGLLLVAVIINVNIILHVC